MLYRCPYCREALPTLRDRVAHLADPRGCSTRTATVVADAEDEK